MGTKKVHNVEIVPMVFELGQDPLLLNATTQTTKRKETLEMLKHKPKNKKRVCNLNVEFTNTVRY